MYGDYIATGIVILLFCGLLYLVYTSPPRNGKGPSGP